LGRGSSVLAFAKIRYFAVAQAIWLSLLIVHVPYEEEYTPFLPCCKCGKLFIYVGRMQNNSTVTFDNGIIETQLRRYAVLYFMLGLIERELRKRVVTTLSSFAHKKGRATWFSILPQTKVLSLSIQKAVRRNGNRTQGVEEYLPFGFWRRIFVGSNFISLWIPALHLVFPELVNPLEKRSFDRVGTHLHRASQIRNRVAHYDIREAADFEQEKSALMWLILAMDKPFMPIGELEILIH
jgi:hypothetical protein